MMQIVHLIILGTDKHHGSYVQASLFLNPLILSEFHVKDNRASYPGY